MATLEEIASELADECIEIMDKSGDHRMFMEVAKEIGASSQTLEEAFLTEVRVRLAGRKAQAFLKEKAKAASKND